MNSVFSSLCASFNLLPLYIMLGVYGAIFILILINAIRFGIRHALFKYLFIALALGIVGSLSVYFVLQILKLELYEQIDFCIRWLPTILFVIIVGFATLFGIWRGLRKSLLFALHAVCAGAVSVAFFFIMAGIEEVDAGMLNFLNFFAGGDGALQRALGVSESCSTLKEVLANFIPTLIGSESEFAVILSENTAYIYTLVDMAYRIVIALLALLIHISLEFTLFIVYHLCYSQRKYKKTRILEFQNGTSDKRYRVHRLGGGVVGCVRGIAIGLLSLSFLGSALFAVAGGKGEGKLGEYDFGNNEANFGFNIYRSIEGYGAQGIFSILNVMTDAEDTPFYLFAADLIFSGELDDEEAGVSGNINLREELAAFTGFARDTLELVMKYGSDELDGIVGGEVTDDAFNTVISVMTKPEFRYEFNALIDAFDAQTYLINLSMSLINSIVSNIDEVSFAPDVGDGEKELLKLIFKKGYLSAEIPDERALIEETGSNVAEEGEIRPYITVNHIFTKSDVKTVLNVALSVLAGGSGDALETVQSVIPEIAKLSILQGSRKSEFNPVLGRMYCLFENEYLTLADETGVTYSEIAQDGIDWIGEINTLIDTTADCMTLYGNVFADEGEALDKLKKLFDETDAHYTENMRAYDKIILSLTDSRVLGRALSTGWFYNTVLEALSSVSENVYLPRGVVYNNVYENGKLVEYGELFKMMSGLKIICSDWQVFESLSGAGEGDIEEILETLSEMLENGDGIHTLTYYVVESAVLRSMISTALIETGGNTFYVPKAAREKVNGEFVNYIVKEDLQGLLENMTDLVEFVMPFVGDSVEWMDNVNELLENIYELVQRNVIFEGTVAQIINAKLQREILTVPKSLSDDVENWLSDGGEGELLLLIKALQIAQFNVSDVLSGGEIDSSDILGSLTGMSEDDLDAFFSSSVIQYTISKYLIDERKSIEGIEIVVPVNSRVILNDDVLRYIVKKSELVFAFREITRLGLSGDDEKNFSSLLVSFAKNKDVISGSRMISASIVATLVKNDDGVLDIPQSLLQKGTVGELEYFDSTNPWTTELLSLINALDEILDLQNKDDGYEITERDLSDEISSLLISLNGKAVTDGSRTRLQVLYDSLIVRNKITVELDKTFTEDLVYGYVLSYVKIGGYYSYEELSALSDAANALELNSAGSFEDYDFNDISKFNEPVEGGNGETLLEVIYRSDVVAGIITKNLIKIIDETDGNGNKTNDLYDHPKAYRTELKVLKESEVAVLVNLCDNLDEIELNLDEISKYLYDDGVTASYILVASISEKIITSSGLIVPNTVVETLSGKKFVKPVETRRFVDAFNALMNTEAFKEIDDITDVSEDTQISVPDKDVRAVLFESEIIRARIVWQLSKLNDGGILAVSAENGGRVIDIRENAHRVALATTISAEQLEALALALEIVNAGEDEVLFEVPDLDIELLQSLDANAVLTLFKSDLIRYRISDMLNDNYGSAIPFGTEEAFILTNGAYENLCTADVNDVIRLLEKLNNAG